MVIKKFFQWFKKSLIIFFCCSLCACAFFSSPYALDEKQTFERAVTAFNIGRYDEALKDFQEPVLSGNPDAMYMTGLIYLNGLTGEVDLKKAEKIFLRAANKGHYPSQIQLAYMYKNAQYALYDPAQAYYWFSVICEKDPAYEQEMDNLSWALESLPKRKRLVPAR